MRAPFLILLVLLLAGCGGKDEAADETAADSSALPVSLAPAQQQAMARTVLVSGPVTAYEEMQLGVEISGQRVTALPVDVGQWVKKGQVLLQLDHRTLDSELAQADASLRQAQASQELARMNYERSAKLAAQQLISASSLDELRANRINAEAQTATARAARDAAKLRRDFADLRAPADGLISKRLVQPGQVVSAGTELLRLIRDGRLEWRAELPENQLADVAVGNTIELRYAGQVVTGSIRAVTPGVDAQTRTGTLYADLPTPGPLKPGVYVEGRIVTGDGQALTIPTAAIVQRDGHNYVFTVTDKQQASRHRVSTGQAVQGRTAILEGLKAGDQVVVEGAGFLGEGDRVRVVTTPQASDAKAAAQ
ncbi:efflux RND transporter periplasmic adaptor subunit [Stenotrophomonas sp. Betaine-02u-21]|uniref:efflux RND transporter periplasmic adaptor subunit n=1 Tax=unclassified Stenotrophomonas TaxID=196198 RepID=UPI000C324360|nr:MULTISPECIES: efflux RND transporter periplasmic adaptor subunit [unclassified Stenotrophomonas]PKH71922.1 efflux RND transporter periplasmic adaptor subunit [Stenotrophomonas sp. Betaine-02u-23]PKH73427.1 efflux RND transporter periplasmic adaptor subunit [Stenotrophomonas sp. Betaine-02u-21]PKH95280.1 efflux RND transporter periplasmic adaptor subunit [Stenotrophomonas sp. Bg11-02]